jgi:hypothetical protein
MEAVAAELLAQCVDGPRMSETNATVAAAFTAGCAAGMGPEVRAAFPKAPLLLQARACS